MQPPRYVVITVTEFEPSGPRSNPMTVAATQAPCSQPWAAGRLPPVSVGLPGGTVATSGVTRCFLS